ncbi:MAG: DUF177 domain-containing protein [Ruminococcaceae bacterium]|nr:DUF177 domain-containing protein [Oscillospiraceae bacterium]
MFIDISHVLKGEGEFKEFEENLTLSDFSFFSNDIKFASDVKVCGVFKNLGSVIFLEGKASAVLCAQCGKCLKEFNLDFDFAFDQKFSKNPQSDDVVLFGGNEISIDDTIVDALCMNLPISFVCKDDCKGLCHKCGKNLNDETCDCEDDDIDPRMAVLKNFLK